MKRSKVIESLAIKLYSENVGNSIKDNEQLAHDLLLFLENSKMIYPPALPNPTNKCIIPGFAFLGCAWENE